MKSALPLIRALALLASLLPFTCVHATTAVDGCTPQAGTSTHTGTVNIGRDALAGRQVIGPWLTFDTVTWICTRKSPSGFIPVDDQYAIRADIGAAVGVVRNPDIPDGSLDGNEYGVYRYNAKLHFIAEVQYQMQGEPASGFMSLKSATNQWESREFFAGGPRHSGDTFWFKTSLRIRMVKVDSIVNFPSQVTNFSAVRIRLHTRRYHSLSKNWEVAINRNYVLTVSFPNLQAACTTPNIHVDLVTANVLTLASVGNAGPAQDFALRIENCPPYMRMISYHFQPVPAHLSITDGILPLDTAQSTATGVGVQVLRPDDTPLVFGSSPATVLSDYDPFNTVQPTYTVPLKARIIRVPGPLNVGTVHAAMALEMRYR